jgi:hypothetical protein
MNQKNILAACVVLILLFIVNRLDSTSSVAAFGLISLAQVVLTALFVVVCVRLSGLLRRRLKINVKEPRTMIWGGAAALVISPVWLFAAAAFFSTNPAALGLTREGGVMITIFPTLFLAGTGLSAVIYGIILRYIASRPDA